MYYGVQKLIELTLLRSRTYVKMELVKGTARELRKVVYVPYVQSVRARYELINFSHFPILSASFEFRRVDGMAWHGMASLAYYFSL